MFNGNEDIGYHEGATVVSIEPKYKGIVRQIGIIDKVVANPHLTIHPFMVTFYNGLTVPQSKKEIIPLSWYLMIRREGMDGEFRDSPISPRNINEDF